MSYTTKKQQEFNKKLMELVVGTLDVQNIFNSNGMSIKSSEVDWNTFVSHIGKICGISRAESMKVCSELKKEKSMEEWMKCSEIEIVRKYAEFLKKVASENKGITLVINSTPDNHKVSKEELKPNTGAGREEIKHKSIATLPAPKEKASKAPTSLETVKPLKEIKGKSLDTTHLLTSKEVKEVKKVKEEVKEKKESIPKHIKTLVWNEYIGPKSVDGLCVCCQVTPIHINSFHCGHVISEKEFRDKGQTGHLVITNLRPICANCNLGMKSQNMRDFCKTFFGRDIK